MILLVPVSPPVGQAGKRVLRIRAVATLTARASRRRTQVMSARVSLEPVDAANVTVLVDNFIDVLLPSSGVAQRPQVAYDMLERERGQLIAEHGLSLLLTIK